MPMTIEQKFILTVLRNHLSGEKTLSPDNIDWNIVYEISNSHQITAIVFYQCKEFIPRELIAKFNNDYSLTVSLNVKRDLQNKTLEKSFGAAGLDYFFVKGTLISQYYPVPILRTMGDTDIVISNRDKANEIMLSEGFLNERNHPDYEWCYFKNNLEYEIHTDLIYDDAINTNEISSFLKKSREFVVDNKLDINYHFIFVLLHLRKHFMERGVGFRQFIDVAVFSKDENLDWSWIENRLEELKILQFSKTVFSYIKMWFGIDFPIPCDDVVSADFDISTEYIFKNGVFGFDNADTENYKASNNVRNSKMPHLSMFFKGVRAIFLPYRSLIASDNYKFLNGRPYLLPAAWVYRIFKTIKNRNVDTGKKVFFDSFADVNYIKNRQLFFENWGLE